MENNSEVFVCLFGWFGVVFETGFPAAQATVELSVAQAGLCFMGTFLSQLPHYWDGSHASSCLAGNDTFVEYKILSAPWVSGGQSTGFLSNKP